DLDPSRIFGDDSRDLIKGIEATGWRARRLSSLIATEPVSVKATGDTFPDGQLFIPTNREGKVATASSATGSGGRVLSILLDAEALEPSFLAAWLNSEHGVTSRRRAIEASSTGKFVNALRSDASSLMRWADELIVPVPDRSTQLELASADERLASFEAELSAQRESIWASPETAESDVSKIAGAVRADASSSMRWADELMVPVPDRSTQLELASADERLASFEAELSAQRESIWASPETAESVVSKIAGAFDNSLSSWLEQLPYPIASALWTAETASTPGDQQRAYIHAWEAIVTFHATVLLSASRTDPAHSSEVETANGETLKQQHLGIERASFGTWVIIIERVSKEF